MKLKLSTLFILFSSYCITAVAFEPRCGPITAVLAQQYDLRVIPPSDSKYSEEEAGFMLEVAMGAQKTQLDKMLPGFYDYMVLSILKTWQQGFVDRRLYIEALDDGAHGAEIYHPLSFWRGISSLCYARYPSR